MGKRSALRMCTGPLFRNMVIGVERATVAAAAAAGGGGREMYFAVFREGILLF